MAASCVSEKLRFSVASLAMAPDLFTVSLGCLSLALSAFLYWLLRPGENKGKSALQLSAGSLSREQVPAHYQEYAAFFQQPEQINTPDLVPRFVDTYYNLVTDIYEWAWGESFHFSPAIPGKSHREEARLHEVRVADLLKMKPGDKVLDAGCGIGGPMRCIAAYSGANVVGITINEYQVKRARSHNKKAGLNGLCEVICGNFLQMPFPDDSFDRAYTIEATVHAPQLRDVYAEIYRVLKPGKLYVSYEWVTTPKFCSENAEHVEIIHGIERGDALPGIPNYERILEVAKEVGFEVLTVKDLALPPAEPWWKRLNMGLSVSYRSRFFIALSSFLGFAPKGLVDVHEMLSKAGTYIVRGAETGIFSPMYLLLCRKPD